jgi:hypothetical protein
MSIRYVCKYCSAHVGEVERKVVSETELGFDQLTSAERTHILHYDTQGNMMVKVTCEHCQEVLDRHPELVLQSKIHQ